MSNSTVAQPRAGKIGEPQRKWYIVPNVIPVPPPLVPEPVPVPEELPAPEPERVPA